MHSPVQLFLVLTTIRYPEPGRLPYPTSVKLDSTKRGYMYL